MIISKIVDEADSKTESEFENAQLKRKRGFVDNSLALILILREHM